MPIKTPNLTGQKLDKREVLGFAGNKNGRNYWNVKCDCGHTFSCLTQALYRGGPCIMCGHKGARPYRRKRPYEVNYNSLVQRARHPVLITYEQFAEFARIKDCHYCGAEIVWTEYRQKGKGSASNLDRKDAEKPYQMDNLVVCCARCNYAKNTHFTYDEWKQLGNIIRSWRTSSTESAQIHQGCSQTGQV